MDCPDCINWDRTMEDPETTCRKSMVLIPINAIAWIIGVAIPFICLGLVPDQSPTVIWLVVGIISGILMGFVVGAITGIALIRLI
jgi:hypothetical protein